MSRGQCGQEGVTAPPDFLPLGSRGWFLNAKGRPRAEDTGREEALLMGDSAWG